MKHILCFILLLSFCGKHLQATDTFVDCTTQAKHLSTASTYTRALALSAHVNGGLTFITSQSGLPIYQLCVQTGETGRVEQVQLDTGSTGVVMAKKYINSSDATSTGICQSFDYNSSHNSYWGEMMLVKLKIFGTDSDYRYVVTDPMPIMVVEYYCKGINCLDVLKAHGDDKDCTIRNQLANHGIPGWGPADGVMMMGIGYDRGAANEGYSAPVPQSRNPALRIDSSALVSFAQNSVDVHLDPTWCTSKLDETEYLTEITPIIKGYSWTCRADPANPTFNASSSNSVYGYVIDNSRIRFMTDINLPPSAIDSNLTSFLTIATSKTSAFQCVLLPSRPVEVIPPLKGPPGFTCWASGASIGRLDILKTESVLSPPIWGGQGALLPDTGISYEILNVNSSVYQPCIQGWNAVNLTFPISFSGVYPANYTPMVWSYKANFDITSSAPFNKSFTTVAINSIDQPPASLRVLREGCSPLTSFSAGSPVFATHNSGRYLMVPFAYLVDIQRGIVGFSTYEKYIHLISINSALHLKSLIIEL